MATEIGVNNIWEIKAYTVLGSQLAINRWRYLCTERTGIITDSDVLARFDTVMGLQYRQVITELAEFRGYGIQRIFPNPKTVPIYNVINQGDGLAAGDPLPKQVCGIISSRTDFAGREYRGRSYLPFPSESHNEPLEGRPNAAYIGLADAIGEVLDNPLVVTVGANNATLIPVLYRPGTHPGYTVTNYVARPYWATQRRRGDYGAKNTSPI